MKKLQFGSKLFLILLTLLGVFMALSQMKRQIIINEYGEHGIVKTSKDKESFLNSIIKGYHKLIDNEVEKSFYKNFQMYGNLSARYFISNYGESILYIYPSNKKTLRIDYLDKPAQVLLSHGLIDLNNPESAIKPEILLLNVPRAEALSLYKKEPSNIIVGGGNARNSAYIGMGTLRLNNFYKIIQFNSSEAIMTICSENFVISTSDPLTKKIYGRDMEFTYNLNGPLLISNVTNFNNVSDIGVNIGATLAERHIKKLLVSSKAFNFYINEKKLKPLAEAIVENIKRGESDPSLYPFWKLKSDLHKMHIFAKKEGITHEDVDKLIDMLKAGAMTGTLLVYYKNSHEFVMQWLLINAILFTCMTLLVFLKAGDSSLLNYLLPFLKSINVDKFLLSAVVVAVNGWVFAVKPAHLDVRFWVIPGISILTNLCVSGYLQKYFMK